ncbi:Radical SAM domain protein [Ammonifex degensii KC4]|uniref:Radical SAM domain protein n=1 Tax=Ammonifex degensii (strain DSM 10501 / KC4) TaxID=429009 RepID=C9R9P6_AMMDK|nr:TIGR03960 family B12-binding radical SAM protein [Ammonifex degensii]ACX53025.1 Radical SAM domain protein [Ammonifex degensii KC4]
MPAVEELLPRVSKPARYVGGEYNSVRKNWDEVEVKIAFAFPDVYEVGMSYLGLQILYHAVNSRPDALLERVFAPWPDMETLLRSKGIPLFTLESHRPVKDFDILAITLQYELTYTNILNLLDLAGIPLLARERGEDKPLVVGGGPCAFNPEPLAPFFDLFVLGDGEEAVHELIDLWREVRRQGGRKQDFLRELARRPGFYVPSLYRQEGKGVVPLHPDVPARVRKRVVADLDQAPFPPRPVVPWVEAVHDRAMIEVFRGCTRGCRFCQAGMIYRPVRERTVPILVRQGEEVIRHTGYDELSLTSLSTVDYTCLLPLLAGLKKLRLSHPLTVSLPSLRVDAFAVGVAEGLTAGRKSSLTFAPEAGTQRLRNVINKKVTEEDLLRAAEAAFKAGWQRLKLYFMIGLPTETEEDIKGIGELVRAVLAVGERCGVPHGRLRVAVSVACFVPKAHTPFQWEPQISQEELRERLRLLQTELRREKRVELSWHEPRMSLLEAVFARGDRNLAPALLEAWRRGCRFDGWREHFSFPRWEEAFTAAGVDPYAYAYRRYAYDEVLPWDHLDAGVSKKFLVAEHQRAYRGETTPDCREGKCVGCGVCPSLGVRPVLAEEGRDVSLSTGLS